MVSIWFLVGLVLGVNGLIVTASGFYFLVVPNATARLSHNPGLWWGAIMIAAGIVFVLIGARVNRHDVAAGVPQ
jgi:hypothetical protein